MGEEPGGSSAHQALIFKLNNIIMKNAYRTLIGLGVAALAPLAAAQDEPAQAPAPAPEATATAPAPAAQPTPEEIKEVFSYLMGYRFGQQMSMEAPTITIGDFDQAVFFKAVENGLANKVDEQMEQKDIPAIMTAFVATLEQRNQAKAAANLEAGKKFLEENGKKEGVVTTDSGLQYKVLKESRGMRYDEKKHGAAAECSVIYEGRLLDGTVFDATEAPITMPINRVVPGFSEALKLMPVGSTYEVYIPSNLAYGENGPGIIGNNATLIFKLTLTDIQPAKAPQANPYELSPEILEQLQQQGLQPAEPEAAPAK